MKAVIIFMFIGFTKAATEGCMHKGQYIRPSEVSVIHDCTESCYCPPESDGQTSPTCYPHCQKKTVTCKPGETKQIYRTKAINRWRHETSCTCEKEKCIQLDCPKTCPSYNIQCGKAEHKVKTKVVINGCECSTETCVANPPKKKKKDGGGCFSETSFVRNGFGTKVSMKSVQVGDKVLTVDSNGHPVYSEVIMMMHRNPNAITDDFVKINTANNKSITLTKYHLIPTMKNMEFVYSKDVKVHQRLKVFDENTKTFEIVKVASVEQVRGKGYYAPLTNHGTIVVDDVYASCYASFPFHHLSHWAFSFYRSMYPYMGVSSKQINAVNELHWYPHMLRSSVNALNVLKRSL